jgi:phosphate starvation-inducible protein PhoH
MAAQEPYTVQLKAMEVDALVDISAKGGIDSTIEAIVREFQPLMYVSTGTAGKIFMIVDGHAVTAASMQVRLRALGTVDSIDLSSGLVVERELDEFSAA